MKNRKRNRLQGYDYSRDNLYFVTICVKGRLCCFGNVVGEGTGHDLSVPDLSVRDLFVPDLSVPDLFVPDLSEGIVDSPNQTMKLNEYGLIVKEKLQWLEAHYPYIILHNFVVMPNHVHAIIEINGSGGRDSSRAVLTEIKIKSLSSLIGAFKTTSSKMIHNAGFLDFAWHRSFHDHIIRTETSYLNITNYIDDNP